MPYVVPGQQHEKESVSNLGDLSIRLALITRVDELHMKADLYVITGGTEQFEIDLTQAMAGPRSFWGGVPEVNSIVIIGYRRLHKQLTEAVILGYIPKGFRSGMRFDPFAPIGPSEIDPSDAAFVEKAFGSTIRYKTLRMKPGDVGGMSSAGAEMVLSKDIRMSNRAGDLLELRDADRTLITQSIHRVDSDSAAYRYSGPIRRGLMNLPPEIFAAVKSGAPTTLLSTDSGYNGRHVFQNTNPRATGPQFADSSGKVLDRIVDSQGEFPPATYSNGRTAYLAGEVYAVNPEDPTQGGTGQVYTESRLEVRHLTDMQQEVRDEIDGFSMSRPVPFIEQVMGTYFGNDPFTDPDNYARALKPLLFTQFAQRGKPQALRLVGTENIPPKNEAFDKAAGYLFRLRPTKAVRDTAFVVAINKQGKLFANIPASIEDDLPDAKNISAEVNMEGALKMRIGASTPDRISAHITLEGGLHLDIGSDKDGNAPVVTYHSGSKTTYKGVPNTDDVALSEDVQGNKEKSVSGNENVIIGGKLNQRVDGGMIVQASRANFNFLNGFSGNYGEKNELVSGKSQLNYAQVVMETIATGGKISTILAGGSVNNIVAGAFTQNVLAGATSYTNPAGAYSVTVGTGALSLVTGAGAWTASTGAGAMSLSAAAGAIAITAGLACNITGAVSIILNSPQVLVGAPVAPFGVCRGAPMMPPGSPSLDWITGLPLAGSAVFRAV